MDCPCVFVIFQLGENPVERRSLVLRYPSVKIFCSSVELLPYCLYRFPLFFREGRVHEFFHVWRFTQKALQSKIASNYESHKNTSLRNDKYPLTRSRIWWNCFALSEFYFRHALKRIQSDGNKFYASTPNVEFFLWSVTPVHFQWFPNRFYITLLDAPLDSDVTALLAFVGFSKASIMSWWMSICFLWSALLAVWNTFNSPISCKSFKVSSLTICIVGASEDFSCFIVSSSLFERLPDAAFFAGALSCGETSSSRLRDGRHPIMLSLKHSRI